MPRKGSNPAKLAGALPGFGSLRLIVPLYLPSEEGYFEQGLHVFDHMLQSIEETTDARVQLTVINNGSSEAVACALDAHQRAGRVDRVVHSARNRGKRDVVLAELRATYEPFAVVADADVVFRPGWVDAVLAGFAAFPECGLLSLHPAPDLRWLASTSVLSGAWTAGAHLCRAVVLDHADADRFSLSVGRVAPPQPSDGQLLVTRNGSALMLGFGHFAFATRREVVSALPSHPWPHFQVGTDMEQAVDKAGWWCASVLSALVHHVGNTIDSDEVSRIRAFGTTSFSDCPTGLGTPRRAFASHHLPQPGRLLVNWAARSAYGRVCIADRVFPIRRLSKQPGSATRVIEE